jgi:hypothetical protein
MSEIEDLDQVNDICRPGGRGRCPRGTGTLPLPVGKKCLEGDTVLRIFCPGGHPLYKISVYATAVSYRIIRVTY